MKCKVCSCGWCVSVFRWNVLLGGCWCRVIDLNCVCLSDQPKNHLIYWLKRLSSPRSLSLSLPIQTYSILHILCGIWSHIWVSCDTFMFPEVVQPLCSMATMCCAIMNSRIWTQAIRAVSSEDELKGLFVQRPRQTTKPIDDMLANQELWLWFPE